MVINVNDVISVVVVGGGVNYIIDERVAGIVNYFVVIFFFIASSFVFFVVVIDECIKIFLDVFIIIKKALNSKDLIVDRAEKELVD